jgi:hypothetical protein
MNHALGGVMRFVFLKQPENLIGLPAAEMKLLLFKNKLPIEQISCARISLLDGFNDFIFESAC